MQFVQEALFSPARILVAEEPPKKVKNTANAARKADTKKRKAAVAKEIGKAPKRAKTAYLIFCDKHRPAVLKKLKKGENEKFTKDDMMKVTSELASMWKKCPDKEKKACEATAAKSKKEYEDAKAIYETKVKELKDSGKLQEIKKGSLRAAKKDKDAPKKAPTAYTLFMQEERPKVAKANPNCNFKEVSILMGQRWQNLAAKDKKKYQTKAAVESENYKKAMEEYKQKLAVVNKKMAAAKK